jgi:nucleotide-binding universal stress UspA family protein
LDGSRLAEHSITYVSALRPLGLSEVKLIAVTELQPVAIRRGIEDEEREWNLLTTYLHKVAEDLRSHTALDVTVEVLTGRAHEAILQEAATYQPDFLIVSTHGASGLSRWRFGSVADKVVRGATCATLVVGPLAAEQDSWMDSRIMPAFRSILVPLDGSQLAEEALPYAVSFAEAFGARIHVVSAVPVGYLGPNEAWAGASPKLLDDTLRDAEDYLEGVKARTPALSESEFAARLGPAAQTLADYIDQTGIDLVIMTSHGRGGFLRTALGSTTDRLLGGSAPVLIVRASNL